MGFANDSGYTPATIDQLMLVVMNNVNTEFGTSYTSDTFLGTNFYKFFYALVQELQANEVKTSEIFLKLQDYFDLTNAAIDRPVVTNPGLAALFKTNGYIASIKPITDTDAGKLFVCVDVNTGDSNFAAEKLAINTLIMNSSVAGAVSQGAQTSAIVLSNGQTFTFKFDVPTVTNIHMRVTTTLSENNEFVIIDPTTQKQTILANVAAKYRLGLDFEPQRYYTVVDAPWAASVLVEYSIDGGSTYISSIAELAYNVKYALTLANLTLIED